MGPEPILLEVGLAAGELNSRWRAGGPGAGQEGGGSKAVLGGARVRRFVPNKNPRNTRMTERRSRAQCVRYISLA